MRQQTGTKLKQIHQGDHLINLYKGGCLESLSTSLYSLTEILGLILALIGGMTP
jgi:hypothetical protein